MYYVDSKSPQQLRVAVLKSLHRQLMEENHSRLFGGHFASKRLRCLLMRRYWWDGMIRNIYRFCQGCLPCAAYQGTGFRCRPPLHVHVHPIPVGGPFVSQYHGTPLHSPRKQVHTRTFLCLWITLLSGWRPMPLKTRQ